MSTHVVVNKGFLSTATVHPQYPQRFVAVGEWRMLVCLGVFIGITTMMSWGKAANCKEAQLQNRENHTIVHKLWYGVTSLQLLLTIVSISHSAFITASGPHNITETVIPWYWDLNLGDRCFTMTLFYNSAMHVLKSDGVSTQHCLKPVFTGKKLDTPPPHFTALTVPEYRPVNRPIILAGITCRYRSQSVSWCTESNTFLRST